MTKIGPQHSSGTEQMFFLLQAPPTKHLHFTDLFTCCTLRLTPKIGAIKLELCLEYDISVV